MDAIEHRSFYFSRRFNFDWRALSSFQAVKPAHKTGIPLLMVAWISIADLCWSRTNLATLYVVPLLIIASRGELKPLRRAVAWLVVLTYAIYFLKNTIGTGISSASYFDYRLVNRTMVAVTIIAMGQVLKIWIVWMREQDNRELPAAFRNTDQEVSETLALLCCAPLIVLIAAIDLLAPSNYNLAILYPVPLFICAWTRSRRLPWIMLAMLLTLTTVAYFVGSSSAEVSYEPSLLRNRVLAGLGMIVVTTIVSHWMTGKESVIHREN